MPEEKKPSDDGKPVDQFLAEALDIMTAAGWVERYGSNPGNTAVQYTEHGEKALEALWLAFGALFPHGY